MTTTNQRFIRFRPLDGEYEHCPWEPLPDGRSPRQAAARWFAGEDWSDEYQGSYVEVWWQIVADPDDNESPILAEDSADFEVKIDHAALIREAVAHNPERSCGDNPDDHDWTPSRPRGLGGTRMTSDSECRRCGLEQHMYHVGEQRNSDDANEVVYTLPEVTA